MVNVVQRINNQKLCCVCKQLKDLTEFYAAKGRVDILNAAVQYLIKHSKAN